MARIRNSHISVKVTLILLHSMSIVVLKCIKKKICFIGSYLQPLGSPAEPKMPWQRGGCMNNNKMLVGPMYSMYELYFGANIKVT